MFEIWDRSYELDRALSVHTEQAPESDWEAMRPRNRKRKLWRRNGR